jgi:hypothetical protein
MARSSASEDAANISYSPSYNSHLSSAESNAHLNTEPPQQYMDNPPLTQQQRASSARLVSPFANDAAVLSSDQNRHLGMGSAELAPPSLPFADSSSARPPSVNSDSRSAKTTSLSINYVPTKFTKLHESGVWQHRQPKQGGGREAFADNAGRMGEGEPTTFQAGTSRKKAKLRWNRFKWALFVTNSAVSVWWMQRGPHCKLALIHSRSTTPVFLIRFSWSDTRIDGMVRYILPIRRPSSCQPDRTHP